MCLHVHACMSAKKRNCCFLTFPSYLPFAHFYLDLFCLCCSVPPSFNSTANSFSAMWDPVLERPATGQCWVFLRSVLSVPTGYPAPVGYGSIARLLAVTYYWSRQNPSQFQLLFSNCRIVLSSEYLSVTWGILQVLGTLETVWLSFHVGVGNTQVS